LALLDRDDRWHDACVAAFERIRLPLATTAAVLSELFHLLGDSKRDQAAAWQLLESGAILVAGIDSADLPALRALMERYRDRPMDFADATLVQLGSKLNIADIMTIDHDDFETYRMPKKRKFRIQPMRGSRTER
jgi:predicted nucleic acid-binding protein